MERRHFIKNTGLALTAMTIAPGLVSGNNKSKQYISNRPKIADRNFTSSIIEKEINKIKSSIKDPELAWMFENCFPNTLDTTIEYEENNGIPDTFVITGDIHAMWLRDSTAQVWPYLPFSDKEEKLRKLILGVINRQTKCINIDPYANAFNKEATGSEWEKDITDMNPYLHERKWEIDSLCYTVRLAYGYWKTTGDTSFYTDEFVKAQKLILKTFIEQQRKKDNGPYSFMRVTEKATDTVPMKGFGFPVKPCGLICSTFRPSDDSTIFLYLIPSNYFAVQSLIQMAEMNEKIGNNQKLAKECKALSDEVSEALKKFGTTDHKKHGKIYAFETDAISNYMLMDDANVPSLMAMPYLNCISSNDKVYQNTRNFILSEDNPWYFKGSAGKGVGGPHVGQDMIWPLSIIIQALTSTSKKEIKECLNILKKTHAGTGFMHETFHKNDASTFTRSWFAWANTLFGELIIHISKEYPEILQEL